MVEGYGRQLTDTGGGNGRTRDGLDVAKRGQEASGYHPPRSDDNWSKGRVGSLGLETLVPLQNATGSHSCGKEASDPRRNSEPYYHLVFLLDGILA
jgi:hypothetical protein